MQGPETPVTPGQGRLAHDPADHPPVRKPRIGVLLANLGTPDAYDYWSMRRYLSEFLSDKRVVDYPSWKWQPLLQTIVWLRMPGDVIFAAGALMLALFVFRLFVGKARDAVGATTPANAR